VDLIKKEGVSSDYIFVDAGISGTTQAIEREGFSKLMEDIKALEKDGHKGILYVFEISRLGRTFIDTLSIVNDLERRGFIVWSLSSQESWTRTEDRKLRELMLAIFSWVADRVRDNLV